MATKAAPAKKTSAKKTIPAKTDSLAATLEIVASAASKKKFTIRVHPCEEWPLATMTVIGEKACKDMLEKLAFEGMTPDPKKRQNLLWEQSLKKDGTIHTNHVQILTRCQLLEKLGFSVDWKTSAYLCAYYPSLKTKN